MRPVESVLIQPDAACVTMSVFITLLGVLCLLAGLALSWTPAPLGIVLMPLGAAMIVATSGRARKWLQRRRARHPKLDRSLNTMERKVPERVARPLRKTHPGRDAI